MSASRTEHSIQAALRLTFDVYVPPCHAVFMNEQVKEPLISDLVDLLDLQRATATASKPATHESKSRLNQLTSSSRSRGLASTGAATRSTRREAQGGSAAQLPEKVGGFEQIFPFSRRTAAIASSVGGNEAVVVNEVKALLQQALRGSGGG
eukprot:4446121-Pleurochrysis_carterae.AAC.2